VREENKEEPFRIVGGKAREVGYVRKPRKWEAFRRIWKLVNLVGRSTTVKTSLILFCLVARGWGEGERNDPNIVYTYE
jgi:hypothetical protein